MAKLTRDEFISALKEMTILEVKELVDAMKEEFGVDPSAVAVAAAPAAGAAATATAVGSIPYSSFIASTNSLISNKLISFNEAIKSFAFNLAIFSFLLPKLFAFFLFFAYHI